jgi:protein-S-isoprenylcysteine O-methyltransferase Ste14
MTDLNVRAWLSLVVLALMMGVLLFLSAGTVRYWHAWIYLLLFFGMSAAITLDLMRHDPALLARRMRGGPTAERRPLQRFIMLGASLGFIGLLIVPALDFRFKWSVVPPGVVMIGEALFTLGFGFIARVYRENTFRSATIEVAEGQRVVATGPYAIVRNPMYASALLYLVGTPLALGSYWGLLALALMLPFLQWRLVDEERLLAQDLPGYADYQQRVRYRLVPFLTVKQSRLIDARDAFDEKPDDECRTSNCATRQKGFRTDALVFVSPTSRTLGDAVPLLCGQPLLTGGFARLRRLAFLGHLGGTLQERDEPGARRVTILRLGAVRPADHHQHSVVTCLPASAISRFCTSGGSDDFTISTRSSTAVASLLTF